jgi:hypothetical protein
MKTLLFLLSFPVLSLARENIFLKDYENKNNKIHKSHFFFTLDSTLLMYKSNINYTGQKSKIKSKDSLPYIGPQFGIGYRFKISEHFSTSSRASVNFLLHRRHDIELASEEIVIPINETEEDNRMYGANIEQVFTYRFKVGNSYYLEPFISVGAGYAYSRNKVEHKYNDFINSEFFRTVVTEEIFFQNFGLGFNILSENGLYMYFRTYKNALTVGRIKEKGSQKLFSSSSNTTSSPIDVNIPVEENRDEFSMALGLGYVF